MITTAFLTISYSLLSWILSLLPSSEGFPDVAHTAVSSIGGYFGILSPIVPIATLFTVVSLIFTVEIGIFGFKTVKWIISHIPWVGGRGN